MDSDSDKSYDPNDRNEVDAVEDDDEDYLPDELEYDDYYNYDDDDNGSENDKDNNNDDDYLNMQSQFDNMDVNLPAGVEVSFSWLDDQNNKTSSSTTTNVTSNININNAKPLLPAAVNNLAADSGTSTLTASLTPDHITTETRKGDDVTINYPSFKRFDIVDDFSDHHYVSEGFKGRQPPLVWMKKVHAEWMILEKDLPDTIYVRVCEARMDLLRAVIIGPPGTPYHDGLFVFDVLFPTEYPATPPMVYYYSGGVRLNPNLYDCGKVCLSLLNTWAGHGTERWVPKSSTMLQVLVSIQALILNAKPYFNEPAYERTRGTRNGESTSQIYSENVFILSLKTMVYTLRRPPKHYEDFVAGHFRSRARDILLACRAYMEGAEVGAPAISKSDRGSLVEFKASVAKMMNGLVSNFSRNGSKDCDEFRLTG